MEKPNSLVIRMAGHDLTAKQLFQQAAGLVLVNAVTIQKMVCAKAHLYFAQTAAAKRFRQTERMLLDQKYTAMAQLCRKDTGESIQAPISTGRGDLA